MVFFLILLVMRKLWIEKAFEESEVFEVMNALNIDKAMILDGFTLAFFQTCQEVLKKDIENVFHEFHAQSKFEKSLNASFIAFISKKVGAKEIKDFCPTDSIISKVLANRVKTAIISISKNSFIKGRQILDSILANRIRSGDPGVLCKLDLEKGL